ncbi:MAG: radical SAM protein [Chromatiales bacterium 21-64-14]|nr:MAG: radical SAM protein [Chromatiales bacterium 21-64-14]HQU15856.1 PA0069 family radical SAM protein [Gammaproteobacteria bacterium]
MDLARSPRARKGRGAIGNPPCRYDATRSVAVDDGWEPQDPEPPPLVTRVAVDATRTILSRNDSPDVPFEQSINPYRGCEHGCVYCFARPTHAYLGLSPGLDFESRLLVKPQAAELLRAELRRPGYVCRPIAMGTNTDPYQPIERHWQVTRQILEVLREHRHPVSIVTKSSRVERDLDLLADLARDGLAEVMVSVTTLDRNLARRLEPRAAAPQRRVETLRRLNAAGIPAGVLVAPVIPMLTDAELEAVLEACAAAGARRAGYVLLRLPLEVKALFEEWLEQHEPLKAQRVMSRVRDTRGGRTYDPRFGIRMSGVGEYAGLIRRRFELACARLGLNAREPVLDTSKFQIPVGPGDQLALF